LLSLLNSCLSFPSLANASSVFFCRTFVDVNPEEDYRSYHKPTISSICRSRSPSPASRWKSDDVYTPKLNSTEGRPPFVVRHVRNSQIVLKILLYTYLLYRRNYQPAVQIFVVSTNLQIEEAENKIFDERKRVCVIVS
jgi:hypothetical protein